MNTVQEQARKRWDSIAKPLHSLGLLEDLVVRIAVTRGTPDVCKIGRASCRERV